MKFGGRIVACDIAEKVASAIGSKQATPVDVDLFCSFSQVMRAPTVTVLHQQHRAEPEVIGIPQSV